MATIEKKYLSLEGLQTYDAKIKAKIDAADAATLEAAEKYADDLADNYDPAGTAQTKVNELANGAVKDNTDAISAINDESTGILKQAKDYADGKDQAIADAQAAADAARGDIDELIEGDMATAKSDISTMKGQIDALIAGTYDDTEVRGLIQTNADDIDTLEGRADALEGQMTTLIGEDTGKSARTIANEELAKQLIAENAKESLNELQEIAAWIQSHPDDASAMNQAIEDLEALVGTLPEGVTATTIVAYIQEVVNAEKARAEGVEANHEGRIAAIEGNIGEGTVDSRIATAKQGAIDTAAGDATAKADKALDDAKAYTDAEIDKIEAVLPGIETNAGDIDTLEGRADAVEDRADALEASLAEGGATATAIAAAQKAGDDAQDAVDALAEGEVANLRTDVDALKSVSYVEITTAEIDALFVA